MEPAVNKDLPSHNLLDSHFHAAMLASRDIDPQLLLNDLFSAGYHALLDIGTEHDDFDRRHAILKPFDRAYMAVGLYPSNATNRDLDSQLAQIEGFLDHKKVIAIGEIGLDYFHDYAAPALQMELFEKQLEMACRHQIPVCIHNREADRDVLELLSRIRPPAGGVIHCFSSNAETAKSFLDLGFCISFAGNVTYKKADAIQEALKIIPSDMLLLETDAPYLAPVPRRGKINHPGFIQYTYLFAAQTRKQPMEDLTSSIMENFNRLFKISPPE